MNPWPSRCKRDDLPLIYEPVYPRTCGILFFSGFHIVVTVHERFSPAGWQSGGAGRHLFPARAPGFYRIHLKHIPVPPPAGCIPGVTRSSGPGRQKAAGQISCQVSRSRRASPFTVVQRQTISAKQSIAVKSALQSRAGTVLKKEIKRETFPSDLTLSSRSWSHP